MTVKLRFYANNQLASETSTDEHVSYFFTHKLPLAITGKQNSVCQATLLGVDSAKSILATLVEDGIEISSYSPFGFKLPRYSVPLGFNGERIEQHGHYALGRGYRIFSPVLMRFLSPDSYSPFKAGGVNAYAYCLGDPVNNSDTSGHNPYRNPNSIRLMGIKLANMYKRAPAVKRTMDQIVNNVASQFNGMAITPPIKAIGRSREKVMSVYGGATEKLQDIVRASIVADKSQRPAIINKLVSLGADTYSYSLDTGYKSEHAWLQSNLGLSVEVQVQSPATAFAIYPLSVSQGAIEPGLYEQLTAHAAQGGYVGGQAHKFYERFRSVRDPVEKQKALDQSQKYFAHMENFSKK